MMSDILSMLNRFKSTIAVFVFRQLDPIFLCMAAIEHGVRIEKIT